jgi:hypothetical protein
MPEETLTTETESAVETPPAEPTAEELLAAEYRVDPTEGDEPVPPSGEEKPADEQVPAGEKEPSEPAKPTGDDGFDDTLLKQAADYRIPADEAKQYGSPEALKLAMRAMDRRFLEAGKVQPAAPNAEPKPEEPKAKPTEPAQSPAEEFKLELDDTWEDSAKKAFTGLHEHHTRQHEHHTRQYRELYGQASEAIRFLHSNIAALQDQLEMQQFDRVIAGLGEGYAEVLGTGETLVDLDQAGKPFEQRKAIFETARTLRNGYAKEGQQVPPWPVLVRRAVPLALGDTIKTVARKEVEKKLEARREMATARPTHRRSKMESGDDRAAARWDEVRETLGASAGD